MSTPYSEALREFVQGFWKPGQTIVLQSQYEVPVSARIECEACGWPRNRNALGLRYVHVLKNLQTGHTRKVGSQCVENYKAYMRTIVPTFELQVAPQVRTPSHNGRVGHDFFDEYNDWDHEYSDWDHDDLWAYDAERSLLLDELGSEETYNYYFGDDELG